MEVLKSIRTRRSVRQFQKKEIKKELILKIIDAARWAPSACNKQAWKFIIIKDSKVKKKIVDEGTAYFVKDVPTLVLVVYDNQTDNLEYSDHMQSASAAVQNMHLAAHSFGLGSVWINNLPPKRKLRKIFNIPKSYDPICLVALGYPKNVPKALPRKDKVKDIVSYDKFKFDLKGTKSGLKLKSKRFFRSIYIQLPSGLKKILDPFARKFEKRFDK